MSKEIPYKIYLEENEIPKQWYNVRADMKNKPAPLLNPATHEPATLEELEQVFCTELAKQELNNDAVSPIQRLPRGDRPGRDLGFQAQGRRALAAHRRARVL